MWPRTVLKEWVRISTSGCRYGQWCAALKFIMQLSHRSKSNWKVGETLYAKAKEFTLVIGCLSHRVLVETNYAPNTWWVTSSVPRQHLLSVLHLSRSSWLQKVLKPTLNPVTPYVGGLCNYNAIFTLSSLIRGRQSEKAERAARQHLIRDAVCVRLTRLRCHRLASPGTSVAMVTGWRWGS